MRRSCTGSFSVSHLTARVSNHPLDRGYFHAISDFMASQFLSSVTWCNILPENKNPTENFISVTLFIGSDNINCVGESWYKFRNISLTVTLSNWLGHWGDNLTGCVTWDMIHRPLLTCTGGAGAHGVTRGHWPALIIIATSEIIHRDFHRGPSKHIPDRANWISSDFEQGRGISVESNWLTFQLMVLLLTNGPVLFFSHFQISPHTCNFVLTMPVTYGPIHSVTCSL